MIKTFIKAVARMAGIAVGTIDSRIANSREGIAVAFRYGYFNARLKKLGNSTQINTSVVIRNPSRVTIGNNVSINEYCHIWGGGGVEIQDDVMIASHCVVTSQGHTTEAGLHRKTKTERCVVIERNVWLGAGVIILPGVTIGTNSIVGAGTTISRDVPPNVVIVGSPPRIIKEFLPKPINQID